MENDDTETVIEVLPEIALFYLGLQVLVGGGYDSDIDLDILVAADAGEFLLLEDSQNFCLGGEAHVSDFIQEQCAAVSLLELALMLFDSGGKSSLFVSKQFTFNEFGRNGCAVYFNVRHRAPVALLVKASGHEFLSRTVRAGDENPGISRSDLLYHFTQMENRSGLADHLLSENLLLEIGVLGNDLGALGRVLDGDENPVEVERLLDEIESPLLDTFYGSVDVAVT